MSNDNLGRYDADKRTIKSMRYRYVVDTWNRFVRYQKTQGDATLVRYDLSKVRHFDISRRKKRKKIRFDIKTLPSTNIDNLA